MRKYSPAANFARFSTSAKTTFRHQPTSLDAQQTPFIPAIVGLTATGKTDLALNLASQLLARHQFSQVHLISLDSRQVYQELAILSGADLPVGYQQTNLPTLTYPAWANTDQSIFIHGLLIRSVTQDWSVAHCLVLARQVINYCLGHHYLPLLVGGTGFYRQQLQRPQPTLTVGPNPGLRQALDQLNVSELQTKLAKLNPDKLASLNESDRANPRRLIRAIEIASWQKNQPDLNQPAAVLTASQPNLATPFTFKTLGLQLPWPKLKKRIANRVQARFAGACQELQTLQKKLTVDQFGQLPALSATGCQEIAESLAGRLPATAVRNNWTQAELNYAKRQLTWWKKDQPDHWLTADHPNLLYQAQRFFGWN